MKRHLNLLIKPPKPGNSRPLKLLHPRCLDQEAPQKPSWTRSNLLGNHSHPTETDQKHQKQYDIDTIDHHRHGSSSFWTPVTPRHHVTTISMPPRAGSKARTLLLLAGYGGRGAVTNHANSELIIANLLYLIIVFYLIYINLCIILYYKRPRVLVVYIDLIMIFPQVKQHQYGGSNHHWHVWPLPTAHLRFLAQGI
jgi:hypothetical protein